MYTVIVADDEQEIRRSLIRKVDWGSARFSDVERRKTVLEALELTEKLEPGSASDGYTHAIYQRHRACTPGAGDKAGYPDRISEWI